MLGKFNAHTLVFGLAAQTLAPQGTALASDSSPLGIWARGDGKAIVRIAPCDQDLCAVNTWIKPGTKDERTGDRLVLSVSPSGPAKWEGEAFDPQRNTHFKIEIDAQDKEMTTRGCILAGLLCKDMHWTRTQTASN